MAFSLLRLNIIRRWFAPAGDERYRNEVVPPGRDETGKKKKKEKDLKRTIRALKWMAFIGMSGLALYAVTKGPTFGDIISIIGVAILISGAAFLLGGLLGFLFGIPKVVQQTSSLVSANQGLLQNGAKADSTGQENQGMPYRVNTNLEEISDWLTKILVGVGLTQVNTISEKFWFAAGKLVPAFGGLPTETHVQAIVAALIIHFLATGFFFGYLLTRLFLTGAFIRAERLPWEEMRATLIKVTQGTNDAVKKGVTELTSVVDSRLVENQMFNLLYEKAPSGFRKVIELGENFTNRNPEAASAKLWVYLVCAYGQQHAWEKAAGNLEPLPTICNKALNAIKMALKKDETTKSWLAHLFYAEPGSEDDDLVTFQGETGFVELLGTPVPAAP